MGVSDLMRYELLLEQGGVIAEADSVCLKPIDDLFPTPSLYSVYENEAHRPGYLSPFIAGTPGHKLLEDILRDLGDRHTPETLQTPWISTGNRYLGSFIVGREDEGHNLPVPLLSTRILKAACPIRVTALFMPTRNGDRPTGFTTATRQKRP